LDGDTSGGSVAQFEEELARSYAACLAQRHASSEAGGLSAMDGLSACLETSPELPPFYVRVNNLSTWDELGEARTDRQIPCTGDTHTTLDPSWVGCGEAVRKPRPGADSRMPARH
jgi:hypothetical protein